MLAGKLTSVLPFCPLLLHKTHLSSSIREIYLYTSIKGVWLYDTTAYGILQNIGKLQMSIDAWQARARGKLAANHWSTTPLSPYTDKVTSRRGHLARQQPVTQTVLEQEKQSCNSTSLWHIGTAEQECKSETLLLEWEPESAVTILSQYE